MQLESKGYYLTWIHRALCDRTDPMKVNVDKEVFCIEVENSKLFALGVTALDT